MHNQIKTNANCTKLKLKLKIKEKKNKIDRINKIVKENKKENK